MHLCNFAKVLCACVLGAVCSTALQSYDQNLGRTNNCHHHQRCNIIIGIFIFIVIIVVIVIDCVSEYDQNLGHCSISTTLWLLDDSFLSKMIKTLLVFDSNRDKFEQLLPEIVVVREIVS